MAPDGMLPYSAPKIGTSRSKIGTSGPNLVCVMSWDLIWSSVRIRKNGFSRNDSQEYVLKKNNEFVMFTVFLLPCNGGTANSPAH